MRSYCVNTNRSHYRSRKRNRWNICLAEQCGVTGKRNVGHMKTQLYKTGKLTSQYFAPESSKDIYFNDDSDIPVI